MTNTELSAGRSAKRIAVPDEARSRSPLKRPDYQDTFAIGAPGADAESAEQWARRVFEAAPAPVRMITRLGWLSFGAKLGPAGSPDHVAGWTIGQAEKDWIRLEVVWAVGLRAHLVLRPKTSSFALSTFVEYDRRAARFVWPGVMPVHWVIVRYLLGHAAKTFAGERA